MLDNNVPVFLVTFATQELLLYRNAKTGEAVVGAENVVDSCRYAIVLTRVEAELENPLTGGWKVVEVSFGMSPCVNYVNNRWPAVGPRALCSYIPACTPFPKSYQNCVKSGCTPSFCLRSTIFDDVVENFRQPYSSKSTHSIPDKHSRPPRDFHIDSDAKLTIIPIRIQVPLAHPNLIPSFGR
jgi:hypothetical protein